MGNCIGKPEPPPKAKVGVRKTGQQRQDWGLGERFEPIKFLGRGGTCDTWLFKDKVSSELVAIKLVRRPLPPVLVQNVLREITVRLRAGGVRSACRLWLAAWWARCLVTLHPSHAFRARLDLGPPIQTDVRSAGCPAARASPPIRLPETAHSRHRAPCIAPAAPPPPPACARRSKPS